MVMTRVRLEYIHVFLLLKKFRVYFILYVAKNSKYLLSHSQSEHTALQFRQNVCI